jgi:hypothetical protein
VGALLNRWLRARSCSAWLESNVIVKCLSTISPLARYYLHLLTVPVFTMRYALLTLSTLLLFSHMSHADAPASETAAAACGQNPERCEQLRAKWQAKCAQDPVACEQKKAKLRQRAADFKANCEADPQTCAAKQAKLRERLEQRRNSQ